MIDLTGKTIGIVGLGQIGGSLAGALKKSGLTIQLVGFDQEPTLLKEVMSRSIIDSAAGSVAETIKLSEIVVLALPVGTIIEVITDRADLLREKLLVTDVGSVMTDIVRAAESVRLRNFVSGHPMAGNERRGHEAWDSELFRGCRFFTVSLTDTSETAKKLLKSLIVSLSAEPTEVEAEPHDLALATTTGLVHFLAYGLMRAHGALADKVPDHDMFIGPSFRGATRVADSDPEMVFQMLWRNRKYLARALRGISSELEMVHEALTNDQPDLIRRLFGQD